jgi:hypothetical protein
VAGGLGGEEKMKKKGTRERQIRKRYLIAQKMK